MSTDSAPDGDRDGDYLSFTGASNIERYPAQLTEHDGQKSDAPLFAVNLVGTGDPQSLVGTEPSSDVLMLAVQLEVAVHDIVKRAIEAAAIPYMRFFSRSAWGSS